MAAQSQKYELILDSLQKLLKSRNLQTISVSEIAQAAGIGKGSIYYYFPSKDAILDALVERNYEKPLTTAKKLSAQTEIPPFTRMAMIFQACRNSSSEYLRSREGRGTGAQEESFLHQKYLNHLITELKPVLAEIIKQGIDKGEISFDNPDALAEIVLIVLTVKMDNTLIPSSREEIENTIAGLVSLLEKGTDNPPGSLNFLMSDFLSQFFHAAICFTACFLVLQKSGMPWSACRDHIALLKPAACRHFIDIRLL